MNTNGRYKLAATIVALLGLAPIAMMVTGQVKSDVGGLIAPVILYLLLAFALFRSKRWAAWVAFLCTLVGITLTVLSFYSISGIADWVFPSILLLNIVAALVLFFILWGSANKIDKRLATNT